MPAAWGLGRARSRAGHYLTDTATLLRRTRVEDDAGSATTSEAPAGTVPFRLVENAQPVETETGGRLAALEIYRGYCPAGSDIRVTDQLQVNGASFEILGVEDAATDAVVMALTLRRER